MALIVEDGSIVAGADSYISYSDAVGIAEGLGLCISGDMVAGEAQLRQAYSWLTSTYEQQLQGSRVSPEQTGSMPRVGVIAHGFAVPADIVPNDFRVAQVRCAAIVEGGADLNAVSVGADLASFEVVGVYKESYQDGASGSGSILPYMPAVSGLIKPYTKAALNQSTGGLYREDMGSIC